LRNRARNAVKASRKRWNKRFPWFLLVLAHEINARLNR
jgi:hypothetical protein